jgi:hypothetical protein
MSNIVSFKGANLPAVASLSTALRSISNNVGEAGVAILKMDKTGHWVFGADQTEVEDGSKWAVNPFSFVHGFIAWGDGEVLGEKMVPVTQPLPDMDAAPPNAKRGWEVQIGCSLKCISGDDEGLEVRFSTTSVGGKKAVQALAVEIAGAVEKDQTKPVPVVVLKKDHYVHKSYGRIYTPVFEVVEWVSMDGSSSEGEEAEQAESQTEEPRRRRRSV